MENDFESAASEFAQYLRSPGTAPEPHAIMHRVRAVEPVHYSEVGTWVVLGMPEAQAALRIQSLSVEPPATDFAARVAAHSPDERHALAIRNSAFNLRDEPDHRRLRLIVSSVFSPKFIAGWEQAVRNSTDQVLAELAGRKQFDLLHDFAYEVPMRIMCDLVGVPAEDKTLYSDWTTQITGLNLSDPGADIGAALRPYVRFVDYIRNLVRARRSEPGNDLVSLLISAEEEGGRLSEDEVIGAVLILIIGSHETTANAIGNGTLALLRNPGQFALLRDNPSLAGSAFEEFLRFDPPAHGQPREATEDVVIGNRLIKAGDRLQVMPVAANRDPRVFDDPDRFDITRTGNNHLAFGYGAHFCLGVHLARLEGRHMLDAMAQMGEFELDGQIAWRTGHVRGLTALPVRRVESATVRN